MDSINTKVLSFSHSLEIDDSVEKKIITSFENTMLEWNVQIKKGPNAVENPSWVVQLMLYRYPLLNPPFKQISFQINEMDEEGSVIQSYKYSLDGKLPQNQDLFIGRNRQGMVYKTPESSEFNKGLNLLMEKEEAILKLETTIEYKKEDFSDSKYLIREEAPRVDELPEFVINSLRSRHDIKIKTSDGSQFMMANKEMIYTTSPFFRDILTVEMTEYTVEKANYLETIDILLTFILTGSYKKPTIITPEIASEISNLGIYWIPTLHGYNLFSSIEKHCYEELQKNYHDLIYVSRMLICAEKDYYKGLKLCCIANICHYHYEEFIKTFVDGDHELKKEMNRVEEWLRKISIVDMVKKAFASSKETRVVIKDVSSPGKE